VNGKQFLICAIDLTWNTEIPYNTSCGCGIYIIHYSTLLCSVCCTLPV